MDNRQDNGVAASPPGHQPTASAAVPASSRSGVPNVDEGTSFNAAEKSGDLALIYDLRRMAKSQREGFERDNGKLPPDFKFTAERAANRIISLIGLPEWFGN